MSEEAEPAAQRAQFNLIEEDWIPVVDVEGVEREISVREALLNAEQYRDITGELPTVRFAILRLLLAILYRSVDQDAGDEPLEFWRELWEDPRMPDDVIEPYLHEWKHRFELLSPTEPFMQVPDLRTAKGEWKPLDLIVADVQVDGPLFTMRSELESLTFPEAARWLIHANAYDYSGIKSGAVGDPRVKGGKGYPLGVGWCGWIGGIALTGINLRETLLLNYKPGLSASRPGDRPIWEHPVLPPGPRDAGEIGDIGPISLMTWPQRRFRLHVDGDRVTGVLLSNGDPLDYTIQWDNEIMSGWRFSEPQSKKAKAARYMPRTFTAGRSLWRGLNTLIPHGDASHLDSKLQKKWNVRDAARPAAVITWLAELTSMRLLPGNKVVEISAVSMEYGAQMSSYAEVVSDRLALAAALADVSTEGSLLELAQAAVQRTDRAVRALGYLAQDIDRASGGDGEGASDAATESAYAEFDQDFRRWLLDVKPGCDQGTLLNEWTDQVRFLIRRKAQSLAESAPPSAWIGHAVDLKGNLLTIPTVLRKFEQNLYFGLGGTAQMEQEPDDDDQ